MENVEPRMPSSVPDEPEPQGSGYTTDDELEIQSAPDGPGAGAGTTGPRGERDGTSKG